MSNIKNELILLEFEKVILLVAWKMDWRYEDIQRRIDCLGYQMNGDTTIEENFQFLVSVFE